MKNKILNWIAHLVPLALVLAVPVGFIIAVLLQKINMALSGLILGIPTIAGIILIRKIQDNDIDFKGSSILFLFNQQSLIRIFLLIFIISVIIILESGIRSTVFLLLIVSLHCIILIQIFSKNPLPWVIVTEIVFTLIILIYSATVTSSYYFGSTDIIPHSFFANVTSSTGHIISPDFSEYAFFPLYHIWIASLSLITGFNSYETIIFLTCPVFAVSVVFVYFLFTRIMENQQIVLLSCLLYSSSSVVVFYGTYVVTRTIAFIGFILLLYFLYSARETQIKTRVFIFESLAVLTIIYIILVHSVSTPMFLLLFIILLFCEWIVARQKYMRFIFLFFMVCFSISYWLFSAYSFTSDLISTRLNVDNFDIPVVFNSPFQETPLLGALVSIINYLPFIILLFFGIAGILYVIGRKKPEYTTVFGLFSLITIVLYVPSPLQSIWQTMGVLRFDRFQLLILPFIVLMMAFGIWLFSKYLSQNKIPVKIISFIIVVLFILYSCSSVGLIQYKLKENTSYRFSFNAAELVGFNFIQKNLPSGSSVFSDDYSSKYLFEPLQSKTIQDTADLSSNSGYFVITKKQFYTDGLLFSRGNELNREGWTYSYLPTQENIEDLSHKLNAKKHIYSSNSLEIYVSNN
jgi:hypothetical protein